MAPAGTRVGIGYFKASDKERAPQRPLRVAPSNRMHQNTYCNCTQNFLVSTVRLMSSEL